MSSPPSPGTVLVAEADATTRALVQEWLAAEGFTVVGEDTAGPVALAVVDVPQPRGGGDDSVRRIKERHPGTPIVTISSVFMPSVQRCGACARLLGVQITLAKPLAREALLDAVQELVGAAR